MAGQNYQAEFPAARLWHSDTLYLETNCSKYKSTAVSYMCTPSGELLSSLNANLSQEGALTDSTLTGAHCEEESQGKRISQKGQIKYVCGAGEIFTAKKGRQFWIYTWLLENERGGRLSETIKNRAIHVTMITGQSE